MNATNCTSKKKHLKFRGNKSCRERHGGGLSRSELDIYISIYIYIYIYQSEGFPLNGIFDPCAGCLLVAAGCGSCWLVAVVGVIEEGPSCDTRRNLLLSKNKSLFKKIKAFGHMVYDRTLHLYIHLKSGKSTLRILLVTFCQQSHLFARKPNVFLWSILSVWYH